MMKNRIMRFLILSVSILLIMLTGCRKANQYDLTGTAWTLIELEGSKPIDGTVVTLEFESGQISGTAGCNHYGGNYSIEGETISFDSVYNTEMACQTPVGVMRQEQAYLDILRNADRMSYIDDTLVISITNGGTLRFTAFDPNSVNEVSGEVDDTVQVQSSTATPDAGKTPEDTPSWAYHTYRDEATGITVLIPDTWIVTGIIEGDYAILQSYPEDMYIGGEPRQEGDTKCDLNIQPEGIGSDELVEQWKSSPMTTILSEEPFNLNSGQTGTRFEIESMGQSISVLTELGGRVLVLTCFGDFSLVDEIAATLNYIE